MAGKRYIVRALSVGAPGNKIFRSGDEVSEENFRPGRAEELVALGFLRRLDENGTPIVEAPAPETEADTTAPDTPTAEHTPAAKAAPGAFPAVDDMTVKEIKLRLDLRSVEYPPRATKAELYDLLIAG